MKIISIEPIAVSLPLVRPMQMSQGAMHASENVLVRMNIGAGALGWGEAVAAPTMTGETVESMLAAIRLMAARLAGRAFEDLQALSSAMAQTLYANKAAKAASERAAHAAVGKASERPVCELLGARRRGRVPLLWTLAEGGLKNEVAEARRKRAEGYVAFKIKVGAVIPAEDARRVRGICAAIDRGCLVSADAHHAWTVAQALEFLRGIDPAALAFLEQPVAADDVEGMARIAAQSEVPIGCDEGIHGISDIERHRERSAAAGGSLKIIKMGGLRQVLSAASACESLGMKVNLACKIAESGIAAAALLHLSAVIPSIDWGVSLTSQYLAQDLLRSPLAIAQGHARIPEGPGLGVEVDEERVRRYQLHR